MKILHTAASYWPSSDGVAIAMTQISEGLVRRGHEVTVATAVHAQRRTDNRGGVAIREFNISGNQAHGYSGDVDAFKTFVLRSEADVMLNYACQIWSTDLVFDLLPELSVRRVLVPCGFSALYDVRYAGYFASLPGVLRRYDRLVYLSAHYRDAEFARSHGITDEITIPNGADDEEFQEPRRGFRGAQGLTGRHLLLSVANYVGGKGQERVIRAFEKADVSDADLVFVGSSLTRYVWGAMMTRPGPFFHPRRRFNIARRLAWRRLTCQSTVGRVSWRLSRNRRVHILAGVERGQLVSAYHEADLFVFGSEIECAPIVLIEAMASRTPFISTAVGNAADLPGGVVVADVDEMSSEIARLLNDVSSRNALAEAGRTEWETRHRWSTVVDAYESLYRDVLRTPRRNAEDA